MLDESLQLCRMEQITNVKMATWPAGNAMRQ